MQGLGKGITDPGSNMDDYVFALAYLLEQRPTLGCLSWLVVVTPIVRI